MPLAGARCTSPLAIELGCRTTMGARPVNYRLFREITPRGETTDFPVESAGSVVRIPRRPICRPTQREFQGEAFSATLLLRAIRQELTAVEVPRRYRPANDLATCDKE